MPFVLDFSDDQSVLDNLETVTVTSVRTAGNQTAAGIEATFDDETAAEAQPSRGVYARRYARFTFRYADASAVAAVKPRDTITRPDATVYTVLEATLGEITQCWNIRAVRLYFPSHLVESGTLSRPSNAQDTTGRAALTSYSTVASGIECRVQPEGGAATDVLGRRTIPARYVAYLGTQVDARAKDRLTVGGVTYTVNEVHDPERIDSMLSLICEKVL